MTEAELLSIHLEYLQVLFVVVTLLTSVLFSYLIVAYLVVERLTWPQLALISALFLGFLTSLAVAASQTVRQINAIEIEVLQRIEQANSNIKWFDPTVLSGDRSDAGFIYFWIISGLIAVTFAIAKKRRAGKEVGT